MVCLRGESLILHINQMTNEYVFEWDGSKIEADSRGFILPFNGIKWHQYNINKPETYGVNGFLNFYPEGTTILFDSNFDGIWNNKNTSYTQWIDKEAGFTSGNLNPAEILKSLSQDKGTFTLGGEFSLGEQIYNDPKYTWRDQFDSRYVERPQYLAIKDFSGNVNNYATDIDDSFWWNEDWDAFEEEFNRHDLKHEIYELTEGSVPQTANTAQRLGEGKNRVEGTSNPDDFVFSSRDDFFDRKSADKITNFNKEDGDLVKVSGAAFGISEKEGIIFASASTKAEVKKLSKLDVDFVYFEAKGQLFFDGNGSEGNWGDESEGGLLAVFRGGPDLSQETFIWVP